MRGPGGGAVGLSVHLTYGRLGVRMTYVVKTGSVNSTAKDVLIKFLAYAVVKLCKPKAI